jgi:hypothetical protein
MLLRNFGGLYPYKAFLVTGRGGLLCCEMLRISQCIDSQLTDGGKVVSPTHRPHFSPKKHYFSVSGIHFCWRLSGPQGLVRLEGLGKLKKINSLDRVSKRLSSGL